MISITRKPREDDTLDVVRVDKIGTRSRFTALGKRCWRLI